MKTILFLGEKREKWRVFKIFEKKLSVPAPLNMLLVAQDGPEKRDGEMTEKKGWGDDR